MTDDKKFILTDKMLREIEDIQFNQGKQMMAIDIYCWLKENDILGENELSLLSQQFEIDWD